MDVISASSSLPWRRTAERRRRRRTTNTTFTALTMFSAVADIDLFRLSSVHEYLTHGLISVEQIKQLFEDNQGETPLPVQLEQFVVDEILRSNAKTFSRQTFRDESLVDLYTSFLSDLLQWPGLTHQHVICLLTLIQGLLCQIERTDAKKVNEAFVHACSILMNTKDPKRPALFNTQQYPKVIDYIVQTIFEHQNLYELLLDDKPPQIETIEETLSVTRRLFPLSTGSFCSSRRSTSICSKKHSFRARWPKLFLCRSIKRSFFKSLRRLRSPISIKSPENRSTTATRTWPIWSKRFNNGSLRSAANRFERWSPMSRRIISPNTIKTFNINWEKRNFLFWRSLRI